MRYLHYYKRLTLLTSLVVATLRFFYTWNLKITQTEIFYGKFTYYKTTTDYMKYSCILMAENRVCKYFNSEVKKKKLTREGQQR